MQIMASYFADRRISLFCVFFLRDCRSTMAEMIFKSFIVTIWSATVVAGYWAWPVNWLATPKTPVEAIPLS